MTAPDLFSRDWSAPRYAEGNRQATSRAAYAGIKTTIGKRQRAILDALAKLGPSSNLEIAQFLDCPINAITGRVHELRGLDRKRPMEPRVVFAGERRCRVSGKTVLTWKLAG